MHEAPRSQTDASVTGGAVPRGPAPVCGHGDSLGLSPSMEETHVLGSVGGAEQKVSSSRPGR